MSERVERARLANATIKEIRTENVQLKEEVENFETVLKETRDGLTPIPVPGEPWFPKTNYISGDIAKVNGVLYIALKYNKNKPPVENPDYWEIYDEPVEVLVWLDVDSGYQFIVGDLVSHIGHIWACIKEHTKSAVRVPLEGSQWWEIKE